MVACCMMVRKTESGKGPGLRGLALTVLVRHCLRQCGGFAGCTVYSLAIVGLVCWLCLRCSVLWVLRCVVVFLTTRWTADGRDNGRR